MPRSSYIDHRGGVCVTWGITHELKAHSWAEHTERNLAWHYGDRALAIAAGTDPETIKDVARWEALGRPRAA